MADTNSDVNQEKVKKVPKLETIREKADQSISAHDYPSLGLGKNEYIVSDIERSKIGLVFIWVVIVALSLLAIFICQVMIWMADSFGEVVAMVLIGYVSVIVTLIIGSVESRIYKRNYMIISNQRAFMQTQVGPFATKTQVIELQNVEDVAVSQKGILQSFFHYGEIVLSTSIEIDESSAYKLSFVDEPSRQAREIKKAVNNIMPKRS